MWNDVEGEVSGGGRERERRKNNRWREMKPRVTRNTGDAARYHTELRYECRILKSLYSVYNI